MFFNRGGILLMAQTRRALVWLTHIHEDLHVPMSAPIPLHCDNKFALHVAKKGGLSRKDETHRDRLSLSLTIPAQ